MGMTPFWTQIINFLTIILGSALSIIMIPNFCYNLGDPATVVLVDITSSMFYGLFLFSFITLYDPDVMNISVMVVVAAMFLLYKSFNLSDTGVYKSITMDFTPPQHRGKWNIIMSIIQGLQNLFTMLGG